MKTSQVIMLVLAIVALLVAVAAFCMHFCKGSRLRTLYIPLDTMEYTNCDGAVLDQCGSVGQGIAYCDQEACSPFATTIEHFATGKNAAGCKSHIGQMVLKNKKGSLVFVGAGVTNNDDACSVDIYKFAVSGTDRYSRVKTYATMRTATIDGRDFHVITFGKEKKQRCKRGFYKANYQPKRSCKKPVECYEDSEEDDECEVLLEELTE